VLHNACAGLLACNWCLRLVLIALLIIILICYSEILFKQQAGQIDCTVLEDPFEAATTLLQLLMAKWPQSSLLQNEMCGYVLQWSTHAMSFTYNSQRRYLSKGPASSIFIVIAGNYAKHDKVGTCKITGKAIAHQIQVICIMDMQMMCEITLESYNRDSWQQPSMQQTYLGWLTSQSQMGLCLSSCSPQETMNL